MEIYEIDNDLLRHIKNVIYYDLFVNLIEEEKDELIKYVKKLIWIMYKKFNIEYDNFKAQMILNNNQDIISLILLLLPYIDTKEDFINFKKLRELNDIITLKKNSETYNNTNYDKNLYKLSTLQIDIGKITPNKNSFEEVNYNALNILEQNYLLLLSTIEQISYKLYINWINIYPISNLTYKKSNLYKNTFKYDYKINKFRAGEIINIQWWNILSNSDMINYKGVTVNDVYNVFINFYYLVVKDINFLIFEKYNNEVSISYISYIDELFDYKLIDKFIKKENWDFLEIDEQKFFKHKWQNILVNLDTTIIFITIIYYFENYYDNLFNLKDYNKVKIPINNTTNIDETFFYSLIEKKDIINKIKNNFQEDNFKYIYEFLLISVNKLKNTPYYFILFDSNDKLKENYEYKEELENLFPLYINIYENDKFIDNVQKMLIKKNYYMKKIKDLVIKLNIMEPINGDINSDQNNYQLWDYLNDNRILTTLQEIINNPKTIIRYTFIINALQKYTVIINKKYESMEQDIIYLDQRKIGDEYIKKLKIILEEFKKNIINYNNFYSDYIEKENIRITCRDLFYFAEFLFEEVNKSNSSKWDNLDDEQKDNICNILNTHISTDIKKLSIYNFYEKKYKIRNIKNYLIEKYIHIIFHYIRINCFDITFRTLLRLGILSEFKYNPELTDTVNIIKGNDMNEETAKLKKNLKNQITYYNFEENQVQKSSKVQYNNFKELYENNYYYINNKQYKNLKIEEYKDEEYFDILYKPDFQWFTKYTFNWIIQINFYNKFINKRVILVTGGTGQGKSIHIPKLILYGLKSIDYNLKGKTIITQPRIAPVEENSDYIAKELLVPIKDKHIHFPNDYVDTENASIQYTHAHNEHISKTDEYYLRLTTDGKLLSELTNNFLLKKKFIENKQLNVFKYLNENIFDIIGIDESHEHNSNMDIILSIMKFTLLYNTSLRLFIISATLEDDEPIYRRYYRCINDNLKYPLNLFNYNNSFNRQLIDRRFHISPPGKITQFDIIEYYEKEEPIDEKIATEIGIRKTLDIINSTQSGELLFFTYSNKECIKICKKLNELISYNVVAVPFFSSMNLKYKKYIQKLEVYKKNINFDKNIIVDIYANIIEDKNIIGKNIYNRIIIIATNIAEASITIPNLKYIVDIGYEINVKYNAIKDLTEIETNKISESSRLQRKGRVGRKESGIIYYIYTENSRKDIKSQYSICISDLTDTIYGILYDNYLELPLFYNINYYKDYNYIINNLNEIIDKYQYLQEFEEIK